MKITTSNSSNDDDEYEKQLAEQERNRIALEEKAKQEYEKQIEQEKEMHLKQLHNDKLEMLKLKQGVVEDTHQLEAEKAIVVKPKGWKAVENFFYLNSVYIILFTIFFVIAGFLLHNLLTTKRPDMTVMALPQSGVAEKISKFEDLFEKYTTDVNGDGKKYVSVIHIPIEPSADSFDANPSATMGYQTKFLAELQAGKTMLIISNEKCDPKLEPQTVLQDLTLIYPNNPMVTKYGLKLEGEKIKKLLDWEDMPDGMYIGIRDPKKSFGTSQKKAQEQYDDAKEILDSLVKELSE